MTTTTTRPNHCQKYAQAMADIDVTDTLRDDDDRPYGPVATLGRVTAHEVVAHVATAAGDLASDPEAAWTDRYWIRKHAARALAANGVVLPPSAWAGVVSALVEDLVAARARTLAALAADRADRLAAMTRVPDLREVPSDPQDREVLTVSTTAMMIQIPAADLEAGHVIFHAGTGALHRVRDVSVGSEDGNPLYGVRVDMDALPTDPHRPVAFLSADAMVRIVGPVL